jgi:regulator of nucleoside diphosphate kinase
MTNRAERQPKIYLTKHDYDRLSALADIYQARHQEAMVEFLVDELERAELGAPAGAKVVAMESPVRIKDLDTGETRTVAVVYPGEEDSERGKVSVMTPLGTALVGLPEGARMQWRTRDGRVKSVEVLEIGAELPMAGEERGEAAGAPA